MSLQNLYSTLLSVGIGIVSAGSTFFLAPKLQGDARAQRAVQFSRAGRDVALLNLLKSAKRTLYVRTETLNVVPIVNELAQAQQRGVQVRLELPIQSGSDRQVFKLSEVLMELGVLVEFSSEPQTSFEGAYVLVDEHEFLYSASPLSYTPPGSPRSFTRGSLL